MAETFRLSAPASVRPILRRLAIRFLLIFAVIIPASFYFSARVGGGFSRESLVVTVPLVVLVIGFVLYRTLGRQREVLLATEWMLGESSIRRRSPHLVDVEIESRDVRRIEESSTALIVRGAGRAQAIWIPTTLDGFDAIRARLAGWHDVVKWRPMVMQWSLSLLGAAAFLLAEYVTFTSRNPRVVVPLAVCVFVGLSWSGWHFRKSPVIDARSRWLGWTFLVPAVAALVRAAVVLGH